MNLTLVAVLAILVTAVTSNGVIFLKLQFCYGGVLFQFQNTNLSHLFTGYPHSCLMPEKQQIVEVDFTAVSVHCNPLTAP